VYNTTADAVNTTTTTTTTTTTVSTATNSSTKNMYIREKHVMRNFIGGLTKIKKGSNCPCEQSDGVTSFRYVTKLDDDDDDDDNYSEKNILVQFLC
jgi:hypothetical protein